VATSRSSCLASATTNAPTDDGGGRENTNFNGLCNVAGTAPGAVTVKTSMDDRINNKLRNLHDDVAGRDAVAFRMHLHELARRGLYDAELDALTRDWSTGFVEDVWRLVAERLAVVSQTHENALASS
jgi:hypothetical protein